MINKQVISFEDVCISKFIKINKEKKRAIKT